VSIKQQEKIALTNRQKQELKTIVASKKIERRLHQRADIILAFADGQTISFIVKKLHIARNTAKHWRNKWLLNQEKLNSLESEENSKEYRSAIEALLSDEDRIGAPAKFTPEQVCQIIAVSCELPKNSGYPVSHWSIELLKNEVIQRKIVPSISKTHTRRFFFRARYQAT